MQFRLVLMAALLAAPCLCGPCVPGPLSSYIALAGTGCSLAGFDLISFGLQSVASGTGVALTPADILVTPTSPASTWALSFRAIQPAEFSVNGNGQELYFIDFRVDPLPYVITRFDLDLDTDPPIFPGLAMVTADLCWNAFWMPGPVCPSGTVFSVMTFDNGMSKVLSGSVPFPATAVLGVRYTIDLDARGSFTQLTSWGGTSHWSVIPEPGSWVMVGAGLAVFCAWRRRGSIPYCRGGVPSNDGMERVDAKPHRAGTGPPNQSGPPNQ